MRSLSISPVTFCIQCRFCHFRKIIARGDNISFVEYVDHFPDTFVTHCVYWSHVWPHGMWLVGVCEVDGYTDVLHGLTFMDVWVCLGAFITLQFVMFFRWFDQLVVLLCRHRHTTLQHFLYMVCSFINITCPKSEVFPEESASRDRLLVLCCARHLHFVVSLSFNV